MPTRIQIGTEVISTSAKNTREENYHPKNIMTHQSHDLDAENEEIKSVMWLEQSDVNVQIFNDLDLELVAFEREL